MADIGRDRLEAAGELGVLRGMMWYDRWFLRFLEIPDVLAIVDGTVSNTSIMHLQNGFILPSFPPSEAPQVFQNSFHMDFRRVLNGYMASINVFIPLVDFYEENGGTLVVPKTHQSETVPSDEHLNTNAIPVECPAGSMIVFDSTLYHAAGQNRSGADRLSINHQFTPRFSSNKSTMYGYWVTMPSKRCFRGHSNSSAGTLESSPVSTSITGPRTSGYTGVGKGKAEAFWRPSDEVEKARPYFLARP